LFYKGERISRRKSSRKRWAAKSGSSPVALVQIFSGTANEPLARVTCNYHCSFSRQPFSSEVSCLVPMNVPIMNQPPTLNAINNLAMNENASLQTVSLSGITSGATNDCLLYSNLEK
jgi:hypothetical protein